MNDTNDLISRQAAIDAIEFGITYAKAINKETGEVKELFQASNDELRKAEDRIKQLPSAQRTGRWIYVEEEYCWCCSSCKTMMAEWEAKPVWNYCPNCGARMERDEQ